MILTWHPVVNVQPDMVKNNKESTPEGGGIE